MAKDTKEVIAEDEVTTRDTNGTPAAQSIHTHPSRSQIMDLTLARLASVPNDELTKWFYDTIEVSKHLDKGVPDGAAARNAASINAKPSFASAGQPSIPAIQAVKEDLETIFRDQKDVPEDFVKKALVLFESAVNTRVSLETAKLKDEAEIQREKDLEAVVDKIDGYLEYAAEEFFNENQLAVESSLKLGMYEEFIDGLHELFAKHYIAVPEERTDVMESLGSRVDELETEVNDRTAEVIALRDALDAERARHVFDGASKGLSDTDIEKFKKLSETVEYDGNEEDLAEKLKVIREAHFTKSGSKSGRKLEMVTENEGDIVTVEAKGDDVDPIKTATPEMRPYVAALSRMVARNNS